jgi:hypothetical protein
MMLTNPVTKKTLSKRSLLWGLLLIGLLLLLAYIVFISSIDSSEQKPSTPDNYIDLHITPKQSPEISPQQTSESDAKTLAEPDADPNYKKFYLDFGHLKNIQHAIGDTAASMNRLEGVKHIKIDNLEGLKGLDGLKSLNALDGLKGLDRLGATHVESPQAVADATQETVNSNENISTSATNNIAVDEQATSNATPMPELVSEPLVEATEVTPQ